MTPRVRLSLRFEDEALESEFLADLGLRYVAAVRTAIILAIVLFAAFVPLDFVMVPEAAVAILGIRAAVILTLLVFLGYTYRPHFLRTAGQRPLAVMTTLAGMSIVAMVALADERGGIYYYAGLLLAFPWAHTLVRLRFAYATTATLIILAAYDVVVFGYKDNELAVVISNNFFLVSSILIGMWGSYALERYARRVFIQTRMLVEERGKVEAKSAALTDKNKVLEQTLTRLQLAQEDLIRQERMIAEEKRKAENILFQILPRPVAIRLRDKGHPIADSFADVTVLFADLVDFSLLTPQLAPSTLVRMLNSIFTGFDELADRHGIEKVKTIGDAYMAVCGLPIEREDHAEAMVEFALDMLDCISGFTSPLHEPVGIRIGINTGPVVAGVIGQKRFLYDLWGDTVNLASELESHAATNRIHVSHTTYLRLKKRYHFEPTASIETKGGNVPSYCLVGAPAL